MTFKTRMEEELNEIKTRQMNILQTWEDRLRKEGMLTVHTPEAAGFATNQALLRALARLLRAWEGILVHTVCVVSQLHLFPGVGTLVSSYLLLSEPQARTDFMFRTLIDYFVICPSPGQSCLFYR